MKQVTKVINYRAPSNFDGVRDFPVEHYEELKNLGINVDRFVKEQSAMDALTPTTTQASVTTPVQFLQEWLPGAVLVQTKAKKIDMIAGLTIAGQFSDEEIVQRILEYTGEPIPYSDYSNTPLSSWNMNYETRSVVKFEEGIQFGRLEGEIASRAQIDDAGVKRNAAAEALARLKNTIGIYGYNNGLNRTYGILNDPNLGAYLTSTQTFATSTFLEIQATLLYAIQTLRTQSGDNIAISDDPMILAIATSSADYLSVTSDFGISVREWLRQNYPNISVVSVPEFDTANGGQNVFYLYPVEVNDGSTDDGKVLEQIVQVQFMYVGNEINAKSVVESYAMATAGVMVKRPIDVVRVTNV